MSWPASPNTLPAISMLCCHGIGSRPRHHAARRLNLTASKLKLPCGLHRMLSVSPISLIHHSTRSAAKTKRTCQENVDDSTEILRVARGRTNLTIYLSYNLKK